MTGSRGFVYFLCDTNVIDLVVILRLLLFCFEVFTSARAKRWVYMLYAVALFYILFFSFFFLVCFSAMDVVSSLHLLDGLGLLVETFLVRA